MTSTTTVIKRTKCKEICHCYTGEQITKAPVWMRCYLLGVKRVCADIVINGKCANESMHCK